MHSIISGRFEPLVEATNHDKATVWKRKGDTFTSLAVCARIHRQPVDFPRKRPVMRCSKIFAVSLKN